MRSKLSHILTNIKPVSILVVGDVILDRYVRGVVDRISPESPAQVLDVTNEEELLGGAANVAANVAALGGRAMLSGVVGRDDSADTIKSLLGKWSIDHKGLVTDSKRPTTIKTRFMALRQQMLRVDRELCVDIPESVQKRLLQAIEKNIKRCDGVIISDYGKGALSIETLQHIFDSSRKAGKKVIVDPKGTDYSRYKGASLITPNRKEASLASGIAIETESDYTEAAKRLFRLTNAEDVMITRGAEGMTVFHANGEKLHLPAEALEVFDVSGAGDTVTAAIALIMFSGAGLETAARIANIAASIEVGHVGAKAVTKEEVLYKLDADEASVAKHMNRRQVTAFAKKLKAEGKSVVFTNGCFDILHAGHVDYLQKARAKGDALVVGLNSDKSVRRLKGKGRPITGEKDRLKVLEALSCIDAVTIFDEATPLQLIKKVAPDILVKGGDYLPERVVGKDLVEKEGGEVVIIPLLPGISTTTIIERIERSMAK